MRFILLITHNEKLSEEIHKNCGPELFEAYQTFTKEIVAAGIVLSSEALHDTKKAARVSVVDGKRRVLDGPFTEAKEVVGGYYLIEVGSRDEAIEWAARVPGADHPGAFIEVREIEDIPIR